MTLASNLVHPKSQMVPVSFMYVTSTYPWFGLGEGCSGQTSLNVGAKNKMRYIPYHNVNKVQLLKQRTKSPHKMQEKFVFTVKTLYIFLTSIILIKANSSNNLRRHTVACSPTARTVSQICFISSTFVIEQPIDVSGIRPGFLHHLESLKEDLSFQVPLFVSSCSIWIMKLIYDK